MISFILFIGVIAVTIGVLLIDHYNDELGAIVFIFGSILVGISLANLSDDDMVIMFIKEYLGV